MGKRSTIGRVFFAWVGLVLISAGAGSAFEGDRLYWIEAGAIRRAAVDGNSAEQVLSADDARATISIALDAGRDSMFWSATSVPYTGEIRRATLDGDDVVQLAFPWSEGTGDLDVDRATGTIYYTDPSDCVPDCGSIWRMDPDGSNQVRIMHQDTPFAIAVYSPGGKMCWGDDHNSWIRCSNLDGSDIETVVTDTRVRDIAIDQTSGTIYWTDEDDPSIRRANLDGTDAEVLITELDSPWGIAVDPASDSLFWIDWGAGKLQGSGLDGSNPVDILTGLDSPRGLAFLPAEGGVVPATSTWGLIGLTLLVLLTSAIAILRTRKRRPQ